MAINAVSALRASPILLVLSIAGPLAVLPPEPALAFGGSAPTKPPPSCPKGQAWSSSAKKCVRARSGALSDDELIEQGRQLAVTGRYAEAIDVLGAVTSQEHPLVLTYLGFSYRKQGDVKRGMALYARALDIDPDSVVTREYLGEGYAETGQIDQARLQLAEIEARCGTACEEYRDLAAAIAGVKTE